MNRDELEAVIWEHAPTLGVSGSPARRDRAMNAILKAADLYARDWLDYPRPEALWREPMPGRDLEVRQQAELVRRAWSAKDKPAATLARRALLADALDRVVAA